MGRYGTLKAGNSYTGSQKHFEPITPKARHGLGPFCGTVTSKSRYFFQGFLDGGDVFSSGHADVMTVALHADVQ